MILHKRIFSMIRTNGPFLTSTDQNTMKKLGKTKKNRKETERLKKSGKIEKYLKNLKILQKLKN